MKSYGIIASMKAVLARHEDGTLQLTVPISWIEVEKARADIVAKTVESAELPGFRKGKAPLEVVEKSLDDTKIRDEILKTVLPQAYIAAVEEHNLKPIMNPKIQIQKIEDGKDWEFLAETVEMPVIKLGKYKEAVQTVTAKTKIIVPGQEKKEANFDEIMKALMDSVEITIPSLLSEQEVDRQLSNTLDEIKKLGLTLDQYLGSTNRTAEQLREDYKKKAEHDIKIEFALQQIAEEEKIIVEDKEIEEAILKAKDNDEKKHLESNKYLLSNIIRQQKTLDFLRSL